MKKITFIGAISALVPGNDLAKSISESYESDPYFKQILRQPKEPFEFRDGLLYHETKLCIPEGEIRAKLLHDYHSILNTDHLGETKKL